MNNSPPNNGRPNIPQNQQRPVQGQAQRPAQGQRPIQGQQRPVQGQVQRPIQGQQRPVQGQGQRPIQGQQRSMQGQGQRPSQRPPQQQQRSAQGRPEASSNGSGILSTIMSVFGLSYSAFLTICIAIVAVVLIVSIITGVVVAAYNGAFDFIGDWFNKTEQSDGGGSGGGGGNKDNPKDTLEQKDNSIQKADITLPTATPSGSYVSSNDTGYVPITDEINSAAAILVDVASGKAIAGKEADTRVYPASMTKVMTLLVAAENGKEAGKLLTVEQWMIDYQQKMGASGIMGFKAGEQVTFENALYLINYNSDTIACLMVAKHVAGSEEAFVELMNKKAKALGLTNTHFMNTTGLHDENHYTTCREMAAIMNCAMKNPVAGKIISAHSGRGIAVFENNKASRSATIYAAWFSDSNRFADDARVYGTSGNMVVIGGKTGYEDIPTACFVTIAEHQNGSKYICVTVGRTSEKQAAVSSKQSTTDTETVYREFAYKKVIKETFLAGELYNNLVSAPI